MGGLIAFTTPHHPPALALGQLVRLAAGEAHDRLALTRTGRIVTCPSASGNGSPIKLGGPIRSDMKHTRFDPTG